MTPEEDAQIGRLRTLLSAAIEEAEFAEARIEALEAENKKLTIRTMNYQVQGYDEIARIAEEWQARAEAAETEAARLRAALEEAVEFAEQDFQALTPKGKVMIEAWRAALKEAKP